MPDDKFLTAMAWRGYRHAELPRGCWEGQADVLHALPVADPVSVVSRDVVGDFDLSFEWRLPRGGNSGVFYRVTEDGEAPWQMAPEMQLLHNAGHPDGNVPETSCGALYGLKAPVGVPPCPAGIYNIARIRVRGSCVEHWLNGARVLSCDLASDAFRSRVARSKFRGYPAFAQAPRGRVALQHHGEEAWFRNIRMEVLA